MSLLDNYPTRLAPWLTHRLSLVLRGLQDQPGPLDPQVLLLEISKKSQRQEPYDSGCEEVGASNKSSVTRGFMFLVVALSRRTDTF